MKDDRNGQIVTFYSFKGGTGRTMALANVAWILASNGKRVLVVDWDLESPGLDRFFHPFIDPEALVWTDGVIELIRRYEWEAKRTPHRPDGWHARFTRVEDFAFSLDWPEFPPGGSVDILLAGRQNTDYERGVGSLDWDDFYGKLDGGPFFDALRADMKRNYDYVLIDSRTGHSDIAAICTSHLPDTLVACFALSEQGITGTATVAHRVAERMVTRELRILPVQMRVETVERARVEAGRKFAMRKFDGLPAGLSDDEREAYWRDTRVPYLAYLAYEEVLAPFESESGPVVAAYERLARLISRGEVTSMPPIPEARRTAIARRFERRLNVPESTVELVYHPDDELWADWVRQVLLAADVQVLASSGQHFGNGARPLMIVSDKPLPAYPAPAADSGAAASPLAVYLGTASARLDIEPGNSARIPADEAFATKQLLNLVGRPDAQLPTGLSARFPGTRSHIFDAPVRNPNFTGRDEEIAALRAQLTRSGTAVLSSAADGTPVTLHGMGGIGKTQIALEYVHRYRNAYDLVWWIDAATVTENIAMIDTRLNELAPLVGVTATSIVETAQTVKRALSRAESPLRHWLLVFDNATDQKLVEPYLPHGGHVIITSRDSDWGGVASVLKVRVFTTEESIAHLRDRVPGISEADARRVAERVDNLPIAIALAGAYLAETKQPVSAYLNEFAVDDDIARSIVLSLNALKERSPAAYRLLQLCAVMAPQISIDFLTSDAFAEKLVPYNPSVRVRPVRAQLVRHLDRLALIKYDEKSAVSADDLEGLPAFPGRLAEPPRAQIHLHRLLAEVVRNQMSPDELRAARHDVHLIIAASRPEQDVDNPESWPEYRALWPHLVVSNGMHCHDPKMRAVLIDRIRYLWRHGGLEYGEQTARELDGLWSARLARVQSGELSGDDVLALRTDLLHLRFNLANIVRDQGRFDESVLIDDATLKEQRALLTEEHPHTLMTMGGLGGDFRGLGRYAEALQGAEHTYNQTKIYFGDTHPRTLAALNNLAVSNRLMGNFETALRQDEEVRDSRQRVLPDGHPDTLGSRGNVGRDLRELGRYREAVTVLADVLHAIEVRYGADSRLALTAQANLAVSYRTIGEPERVIDSLDRAFEILRTTYGEKHPDTLACRLSRALNLLALEETERASKGLASVRDAYESLYGPTHPHTLACTNNLAAALRADGRTDASVLAELASFAAMNLADRLGVDHPYTLAATMNECIVRAEAGDGAAALETARKTLAETRRRLGDEHPDTHRCIANITLMESAVGQDPGTSPTVVLDRLRSSFGAEHPAVRQFDAGRYRYRTIDPHPF